MLVSHLGSMVHAVFIKRPTKIEPPLPHADIANQLASYSS